jgi:hypothetical protein
VNSWCAAGWDPWASELRTTWFEISNAMYVGSESLQLTFHTARNSSNFKKRTGAKFGADKLRTCPGIFIILKSSKIHCILNNEMINQNLKIKKKNIANWMIN